MFNAEDDSASLGSSAFRIPSLITAQDSTLLAAIDVRYGDSDDSPNNIDTGLRISKDHGQTWEAPKLILNFLDYPNEGTPGIRQTESASFIDPVMVRGEGNRVYLMVDAFPSGTGVGNDVDGIGFKEIDGKKYLMLLDSEQNEFTVREGGTVYDGSGYPTEYRVDEDYILWEGMVEKGSVFYYREDIPLRLLNTGYLVLIYTDDGGETWSKPEIINDMVKEEWMGSLLAGPGAGLRFQHGPYAGRMLLPVYTSVDYSGTLVTSSAFIYSDDNGVTWRRGEFANANMPGVPLKMSEAQAVEMPDGQIKLFARTGEIGSTAIATSRDGGMTWEADVKVDETLVTNKGSGVQLSVINYSEPIFGYPAVIFSNPADWSTRKNGTVRVGLIKEAGTYSDGQTKYDIEWIAHQTIRTGEYAYSSLAELGDGHVGLLYEPSNSRYELKSTDFVRLSKDFLLDNVPVLTEIVPAENKKYLPGDELLLKAAFDRRVYFFGNKTLVMEREGVVTGMDFVAQSPDGKEAYFTTRMPSEGLSEGPYDFQVYFDRSAVQIYSVEGSTLPPSGYERVPLSVGIVLSPDDIRVEGVTLDQEQATVYEGKNYPLHAQVFPVNAANPEVTWHSSDESVATVDANGVVTGNQEGTAIITVKTVDGGYEAASVVTVEPYYPVEDLIITLDPSVLLPGGTTQAEVTYVPDFATEKVVTWTSADPGVAAIDADGLVKAVSPGVTTITAASGSVEESIEVKVLSTNANLGNLTADSGVMTPVFHPDTTYYLLQVEPGTEEVTLSFLPEDHRTTVIVDGVKTVNGTVKITGLTQEGKTVRLVTKAQNGAEKNYRIAIRELDSDAEPVLVYQEENVNIRNGVLNAIEVNKDAVDQLKVLDEGTVIVRFTNRLVNGNSSAATLFSLSNNMEASSHFHIFVKGNGQIGFEVRRDDTADFINERSSLGVVPVRKVNTFALRADKANETYTMFLNGQMIGTFAGPEHLPYGYAFLNGIPGIQIGTFGAVDRGPRGMAYIYSGDVNEIKIYNRPLSDEALIAETGLTVPTPDADPGDLPKLVSVTPHSDEMQAGDDIVVKAAFDRYVEMFNQRTVTMSVYGNAVDLAYNGRSGDGTEFYFEGSLPENLPAGGYPVSVAFPPPSLTEVYDVNGRLMDHAAATGEFMIRILPVDNNAPETSLSAPSPDGTNGWYISDIPVSLTATDDVSGVAMTEYRINGGEWMAYDIPILITQEGVTQLEYRSVDRNGNLEAFKSYTLKLDKTGPTLKLQADKDVLWPPNHQMVPVVMDIDAHDDGSGIESVLLASVTSNEADNGQGDGNSEPDIQNAEIGTSDAQISLRAERAASGQGREYRITYTATDLAGNRSEGSVSVFVPVVN